MINQAEIFRHPREFMDRRALLLASGSRLVLVKGAYDLLHPSHVRSFARAREFADVLCVAVAADKIVQEKKGETRPILLHDQRMFMVSWIRCVDFVVGYDFRDLGDLLRSIRPNVFSASHFDSAITSVARECDVDLVQIEKDEEVSTSLLVEQIRKL